ncbi:Alpha-(1,3)-fucosyltransferase 4 [Holothuria leucospilota]|uniref:Fucosyltransferase n=1 Tax=Holothuria leucospilota TaxID=206669 RepID=A0A9Q0YEW3_HOLLE|nr:Alpha-(1,3)-fucosyltransferase 4 [Holothuria leucospilota]
MAFNLLIFLYLSFTYLPPTPSIGSMKVFRESARLFVPEEANGGKVSSHTKRGTNQSCSKSIVFFGIREFWFTFCNYERFSHYKYLVRFPRSFECPEVNCRLTIGYTKEPRYIGAYDIVVFTNVNRWLSKKEWVWVQGNRTKGQRWVMVTEESPLYAPGFQPPEMYSAVTFDWFGSYKQDSDFFHPYGIYTPFEEGDPVPDLDADAIFKSKPKLLAWMGSHCKTQQWDRLRFVETFSKLVRVDRYGKCGNGTFVQWNNDTAVKEAIGPYKFYLSLENSCCRDYITEKFWRTLQMGSVPIVVGPPLEDYKKLAPPNSFIHPDQFDNLVDMATHILEVAGDRSKYLEYFQWKKKGKIFVYSQEEYYIRPLTNESNCAILKKFLRSDETHQEKLDYFGPRWYQSCVPCGHRDFLKSYMHNKNHSISDNLWE